MMYYIAQERSRDSVMAGLVPTIQVLKWQRNLTWKPRNSSDLRGLRSVATWMAGTSSAITGSTPVGYFPLAISHNGHYCACNEDDAGESPLTKRIDFQTDPSRYRHWRVAYDGAVATLFMDVDEDGGLFDGYQLKLNSYDLGVDVELADVVQRMRFEHPEVGAVVLRSGKERVFCAGANIRMLGVATHAHKVNFCKFTNETRNTFEAAGAESGQRYICAVKGSCAGGGYELALACDHIILTDDGTSSVALPEVPLLAVLPGTSGLTRVTDKRKVRRDLADVFCSIEEGVKGKRAQEWRLVDEIVPNSKFE